MGGKRQGKGKAKLDVNPDGSLGTEAPIDVAPNQLHRKGTLLAQCCVVRSFPDLGTPWETLGFPGSPLGVLFLQFLDQFWFHFWSLFWGPVLGPALIKYIKGGQKQDPKKGPKIFIQNGTTNCTAMRSLCQIQAPLLHESYCGGGPEQQRFRPGFSGSRLVGQPSLRKHRSW